MRIGIDCRMYTSSFTGIGRYTYELVANILALDPHNAYTLFFNEPEFSKFILPRRGITKILVDAPIYSLAEQMRFLKRLWGQDLDFMHFTHFNAPIFYRRPSIVTIHDLTLSFFPGKKMNGFWHRIGYQWAIRSIVKRAKRIIAVSEYTKKDLRRLFHVPLEKISVIHEGVNPEFHEIRDNHLLETFRKKLGFENPFILYTGNWRDHKNLVNLICAFAIAKKKANLPHFLVITGKEDPWYPEVKETVKENHLEGLVRFTGLVPDEDLVLLYNTADLYVLPSFYEGFGLPALEAFACGTPVASSNTSSLPEVCGGAAEYFDPKDPRAITRAILAICLDPQKRRDLIAKGFARVKQFSWKKQAEETLRVYHDVYRYVHPHK